MDYSKLFRLGKPCFYLAQLDDWHFANLAIQLRFNYRSAVVKVIRGRKSRILQAFFDEASAALQFPYYFGENWAAFDECVTDLDWFVGDAYIFLVSEAQQMLGDADFQDFKTLVDVLARANEEWVTPNAFIPRSRHPAPFHVVLQCKETDQASSSLREKLSRCGVEVGEL